MKIMKFLKITIIYNQVTSEIIKKLYDKFRPTSISINLFRHHDINAPKIDPQIISAYERAIKEYDKIRIKTNYGIIGSHFLKAKERVQKDLILAVSKEEKFVTKYYL